MGAGYTSGDVAEDETGGCSVVTTAVLSSIHSASGSSNIDGSAAGST